MMELWMILCGIGLFCSLIGAVMGEDGMPMHTLAIGLTCTGTVVACLPLLGVS